MRKCVTKADSVSKKEDRQWLTFVSERCVQRRYEEQSQLQLDRVLSTPLLPWHLGKKSVRESSVDP